MIGVIILNYEITDINVTAATIRFRNKSNEDGRPKKGPFFNGTQAWSFEKNDIELFKNAVWQGYLDASRTFHGIEGTDKNQGAFLKLAKSIQAYFNDDKPFDHNSWCNSFIADIEKYNHYNARYGQAQKVVNMAFKYLYCCDNIDEQTRIKFDPCHMPLDQYTLAWYFLQGRNLFLEWSYLNQEQYETISTDIRTILGNDTLRAELVIWEGMKPKIINLKSKLTV